MPPPPAISNSTKSEFFVDFDDNKAPSSFTTTLNGKKLIYRLAPNKKQNYVITYENESINFKRTGTDAKTADGYIDVCYYPDGYTMDDFWSGKIMIPNDDCRPVYDNVFMLSYDVRFSVFGKEDNAYSDKDSLAKWNVGSLRFNDGSTKLFTSAVWFNSKGATIKPNNNTNKQPKDEYAGEASKALSLDQWHNFTVVFNMLEGNGNYTASTYVDNTYVGTVKTNLRASDIKRTQTTFGFDAEASNATANSVVSVDNVFFGVLPDNYSLTADAIEKIEGTAAKITCTNDEHDAEASAKEKDCAFKAGVVES